MGVTTMPDTDEGDDDAEDVPRSSTGAFVIRVPQPASTSAVNVTETPTTRLRDTNISIPFRQSPILEGQNGPVRERFVSIRARFCR